MSMPWGGLWAKRARCLAREARCRVRHEVVRPPYRVRYRDTVCAPLCSEEAIFVVRAIGVRLIEDRLREGRMRGRCREELRFQREPLLHAVRAIAFTVIFIEEVAGIELHAGKRGPNLHAASAHGVQGAHRKAGRASIRGVRRIACLLYTLTLPTNREV